MLSTKTTAFIIPKNDFVKLMTWNSLKGMGATPSVIGMLTLALGLYSSISAGQFLWGGFLFPFLFLVVVPGLTVWQFGRYYDNQKQFGSEQVYQFSQDAIQATGKFSEGKMSWELVTKAVETQNWLLIYTSSNRIVHPIPKSAFSSESMELVRAMIRMHKHIKAKLLS